VTGSPKAPPWEQPERDTVDAPHPPQTARTLLAMIYHEARAYHLPWLRNRAEDYSANTRERRVEQNADKSGTEVPAPSAFCFRVRRLPCRVSAWCDLATRYAAWPAHRDAIASSTTTAIAINMPPAVGGTAFPPKITS
jgi:hypothetical protein